EVVRHGQVVVGVRGADAELPGRFGHDSVLAHQPGDGVEAAGVPACDQFLVHARAAVAGLDLGVNGPHLHEESVVPLSPLAAGPLPPGVVAGRGDLQRLTEQADGPVVLVLVDEAEGHVASLAKNAAAFLGCRAPPAAACSLPGADGSLLPGG